jgi:glutaminyl-peptide cyclotransferase
MTVRRLLLFLLPLAILASCAKKEPEPTSKPESTTPAPTVPNASYEIIATYPHDAKAFTEGLQFYKGELYESTGLNGHSTLRRVELKTGKVLQSIDIDSKYFGEGFVIFGDKIYQLTYTSQTGFVYDLKSFKQLSTWGYQGEGWSMTTDGSDLIMSNGTDKIQFLDPNSLSVVKSVSVQEAGMPLTYVNELEYIKGEIWANIWQTSRIVRFDPATGEVKGWIDLAGLLTPSETQGTDVLNGIAYDAEHDRIFVTGKNWPKLFEIKVKPTP